jgi:hypothetical protein
MKSSSASFARHETFYPRVGWLWKAVQLSEGTPDVFLRDDATVLLGVGKNMVRAIRYWGLATRVIESFPDPDYPRRSLARPTVLGRLLLGADGLDPFLEELRSIWLLHWFLTRDSTLATAWHWLFGLWGGPAFTSETALAWLRQRSADLGDSPGVADESLRRDLQCIMQMYGPARNWRRNEELVESQFRDIGLVASSPGDDSARLVYGPKPGLSPGIVAFACLDYAARESAGKTLTISRLALEPYSPGLVMRLSEVDITRGLEEVARAHEALAVVTPAGVPQFAFGAAPSVLAVQILAAEYGYRQPRGVAVEDLLNAGPADWVRAA